MRLFTFFFWKSYFKKLYTIYHGDGTKQFKLFGKVGFKIMAIIFRAGFQRVIDG